MKIEIILEIIGAVCILFGCVLYLIHTNNEKEDNKIYRIISTIITAIGLALFIGTTNIPSQQLQGGSTIEIEKDIFDDEEIDP